MRSFLQEFRLNLIVYPLLRVRNKIELLTFKRALKTGTLLLQQLEQQLEYLIREMDPKASLEGHDADFDKTAHVAAFRLLTPEIFEKDPDFPSRDVPAEEIYDELKALYSEIQTNVDAIVQEISQEPRVRQVLIHYFADSAFFGNEQEELGRCRVPSRPCYENGFRSHASNN